MSTLEASRFPSGNQGSIIRSGLSQVRYTGINSLCSWISFTDPCNHEARLTKLLKKHDIIYLPVLGVHWMVSTPDEREISNTDTALYYPGRSFMVESIQPGPRSLQCSTRPVICKHVQTPIQMERTGCGKESIRFKTNWRTVCTSAQASKAQYREYGDFQLHYTVDDSSYSMFHLCWMPLPPVYRRWSKDTTLRSHHISGTVMITAWFVVI